MRLGKDKKITIIFCSSIVILFVLCTIMIVINFFMKDSIITRETIVGINPISSTKSIMFYQEPLIVALENEEKNIDICEDEQESEKTEEVETQQDTILTEYKGFATVGKIEIPKTGVNIPILSQITVEGMKNAPCLLYSTGELNQNGNNLIVGHNYRNGTIFSDNKNLNLEDKIYITTLDGNKVEYTIYNKFITTAEDVSYIKRDTNNKPEITLSCCTDDDEYRIIILARI